AMVIVGIVLFFHGIRKAFVDAKQMDSALLRADASKRLADASAPPDYAKYIEAQLRQILRRIDKKRFPDRVAEIETRLLGFETEQKKSET
ncbi:MAG TPA: hypothetical protein VF798_14480, partial [Burkholderiaceae bacterium]